MRTSLVQKTGPKTKAKKSGLRISYHGSWTISRVINCIGRSYASRKHPNKRNGIYHERGRKFSPLGRDLDSQWTTKCSLAHPHHIHPCQQRGTLISMHQGLGLTSHVCTLHVRMNDGQGSSPCIEHSSLRRDNFSQQWASALSPNKPHACTLHERVDRWIRFRPMH